MATIRPLPTLEGIKRLAAQLHITFGIDRDSFTLNVQEPLTLDGVYRNNQAGINSAVGALVRYQDTMRRVLDRQELQRKHERVTLEMTGLEALLCQLALETYANHPYACRRAAGYGITSDYAIATLNRLIQSLGERINALENADEAIMSFASLLEMLE